MGSEKFVAFCRPRRDRRGDLWYMTRDQLVRLRDGRFTTFPLPSGLQIVPRREQFWWQSDAGDLSFECDGLFWRLGANGFEAGPVPSLDPRTHRRERADGKPDTRLLTPDGRVWEARGAVEMTFQDSYAPGVAQTRYTFIGQNGQGRPGSASTCSVRGAKSVGRSARSATIVTQRPVSGLRRR